MMKARDVGMKRTQARGVLSGEVLNDFFERIVKPCLQEDEQYTK